MILHLGIAALITATVVITVGSCFAVGNRNKVTAAVTATIGLFLLVVIGTIGFTNDGAFPLALGAGAYGFLWIILFCAAADDGAREAERTGYGYGYTRY